MCVMHKMSILFLPVAPETVHGTQELIVPREEELYLPVSDVEVQTIPMM